MPCFQQLRVFTWPPVGTPPSPLFPSSPSSSISMDDSMDFMPCGVVPHTTQVPQATSATVGGVPEVTANHFVDETNATRVLANLAQYRNENFLCDVEIELDGCVFKAHRYVLAAAIPYFHSMFSSEMLESRQSRISIKDIPALAFQQLIDFAYTSRVHIDGDNVQQLLYAASILQMDAVCGACQRFLTQYLTTNNCLSIRQFAEQHNCVSLMHSVDDFAMEHFPDLRQLSDFQQIPMSHLADLLRSNDLKLTHEQEAFETVMRWVDEDREGRKGHLPELLALVRLPQLPIAYLLNHVKKHPLIAECVRCRDLVADAMSEMMRVHCAQQAAQAMSEPTTPVSGSGRSTPGLLTSPPSSSITTAHFLTPNRLQSRSGRYSPCGQSPITSRPRKAAAGVVFCVGGRGTSGDPFRSVEAYDWRRNRWFAISDMNIRRRHVGVVSAQGKLYAIGGHDGTNHLDSAECFDPTTNMWHTVSPMDTRRRGIAVGALEGAIYAVGGLDDTACFQTVERYDIESDKWSAVASMNVQRGGVGVAALGKYLFAVGGNDGTSSLDSCERYDPLLNKWKLIASMTHRRAGAGVTVLDGCLYAIGGFDDNAPLNSCERYDPDTNTWTLLQQMSCPRGGVGVAAMGGRIYAIGGHDGMRYLSSVEAFDPATCDWTPVADISQCRAGAGVAWADCRVDMLQRPPSMAPGKDSGCAPCPQGVAHCV